MKNKFKLLVALLAVLTLSCAVAACGVIPVADEIGITVTFLAQDGSEISFDRYEKGKEIVVPEAPEVADADGYYFEFIGWDKELSLTAEENVVYTAQYSKNPITYTATFMAEGVEVDVVEFNVETEALVEPEVPAKDHYKGAWGAYALGMGDIVVNATYTPVNYAITFMNGDKIVGRVIYDITNYTEKEGLPVPQKPGYVGSWSDYDFALLKNQAVQVSYELITYTATFMAEGVQVGEPVEFTVENMDAFVAPEVPAKAHYTGAWEEIDLSTLENLTINAVYTPVEYTISFPMADGGEVVKRTFTIENQSVEAPAVPEVEGYTGYWTGYDCSVLEDQSATLGYTPNTYVITYDAAGGTASLETQEVVFNEEVPLATATPAVLYNEFLGWYDAAGNKVSDGIWAIASDVTLTARYGDGISFENGVIPSFLTGANNAGTLAVSSADATDGENCLAIPVTGGAPSLRITIEAVAAYFADPSVEYIAFDARTDITETSNFRRYTLRTSGALGNECYEPDQPSYNCGIKKQWKTFYFTRADYEAWVANGIGTTNTNNFLIIPGGFTNGDTLYVDNIRPVVGKTAIYSFDGGGLRTGETVYFYMPIYLSNWALAITGDAITASEMTYDTLDGGRALQWTRGAGKSNIYIPKSRAMLEAITATGYVAVDLYVPAGADTTLTIAGAATTWSAQSLIEGAWNTIYIAPGTAETILTITDTTGGTYRIDNIRSVTEAEYDNAVYGFEVSGGGLRDDLASGGVFYYYGGQGDHAANKYSFAVKGDAGILSKARFDSNNVHGGNYSLAFDKTNGYIMFTMQPSNVAYADLKNGFTFWIYSTVAMNGVGANNFIDGCNNKFNDGAGLIIYANEWTQVTITAENINASGRFLIIQGSTAGTIYIDDIRPL